MTIKQHRRYLFVTKILGMSSCKFRYCDHEHPPEILSGGRMLFVIFRTDRSVGEGGFEATYTAVDTKTDCDRTFTSSSGFIQSPGYGQNSTVTRRTSCEYRIQARFLSTYTGFDNQAHAVRDTQVAKMLHVQAIFDMTLREWARHAQG